MENFEGDRSKLGKIIKIENHYGINIRNYLWDIKFTS